MTRVMSTKSSLKTNATFALVSHEQSTQIDPLSQWIQHVRNDSFYRSIIQSAAFRRLSDISFLGALDYTVKTSRLVPAKSRNRFTHSLAVAGLAAYVCNERGYDEEQRRHIVVAALLHDIGHAPLSHSAEPFIKRTLGYGHHEAGEKIVRGDVALGRPLSKKLREKIDINHVLALISGKVGVRDGGDIFSSPFNIDTIDGIIRSYCYLRPSMFREAGSRALEIAYDALVSPEGQTSESLNEFWRMKQFVYADFIHRPHGLVSDKMSERYLADCGTFSESDFFSTEAIWKEKYKALFNSLNDIISRGIGAWGADEPVWFTRREYRINSEKNGMDRFECFKMKVFLDFAKR